MRLNCLLVALLFGLIAVASPARAADPVQGDWPPIPGNLGMKWFLGTWYPTNSQDQEILGHVTYRPDGKIVHDTGYPSTLYRVIEEYDRYVLLMIKLPGDPKHPTFYSDIFFFQTLTPHYAALAQKVGLPTMMEERTCNGRSDGFMGDGKDWALTEEHFKLSLADLKALWDRYEPCNPLLGTSKPSQEYPWGYYAWGSKAYFIPYLPIEDHAREAGLTDIPAAAPGDLYRYPARRLDLFE